MTPEVCPNCGADLPRRAKACPECGSCEKTGWSEEAAASALGLPSEDFDYDRFVEEEFGGKKPRRRKGHLLWAVVALVLALWLLFAWFR